MAKNKTYYECTECRWQTTNWQGQCRMCSQWGTLEETTQTQEKVQATPVTRPALSALPIAQVDSTVAQARPTTISELDRVLGGGIVPGAVILLAGEPGVGKSTLLLEVAATTARNYADKPVLYITGEESASQVRLRAERIGALADNLHLAAETDVSLALGHMQSLEPSLVIIDSVQTLGTTEAEGTPGGVTQVRAVAHALINAAKQHHTPVLLVGHVTKDGTIAGPRLLEHLVDVVCQFEGDRHSRLRLLRSRKNRYGPTDEVGCFELTDKGIVEVPDPSGIFLSRDSMTVPGTCTTVTLEGQRPMVIQIQALIAQSAGGSPRRATSGIDHSRVAMALAVLQARLGLPLSTQDVYASTVGGAKTSEPATDLALALAVVSAARNLAPSRSIIAIGEVGLTGEIRSTTGTQQRLAEAARLGFEIAIIPHHRSEELTIPKGLTVIPVTHLAQAVGAFLPNQE